MKNIFLALLTILYVTHLTFGGLTKKQTEGSVDLNLAIVEEILATGQKLGEGSYGIVYGDLEGKYIVKQEKNTAADNNTLGVEAYNNGRLNEDIQLLDDQFFYK